MTIHNGISVLGMLAFLLIAWTFSENRKIINWKLIFWGTGIQLLFILFFFNFPLGIKIFQWLNQIVMVVLNSAAAGSRFVFGRLALSPGTMNEAGEPSLGFFLAFQAFPTIVFFSALVSLLYFFNILPFFIRMFARLFSRLMKLSGAESLCAASNIFIGIESMLTIKPYLQKMTRSELCTILTAAMATVASNVMGIYVFSLHQTFPQIAGHLISASFISAPAALVISKLLVPETEVPQTMGTDVSVHYEKKETIFETLIDGAGSGVKLIVGITGLLLAVLGLVELLNVFLKATGNQFNQWFAWNLDFSLKGILGYIFYPFTLLLGIPLADAKVISKIIGERLVVTEVTAYIDLAAEITKGTIKNPRSGIIASYVLCGFAHIASLSIFVGGISALVPEKTKELSSVGLKALTAATLATLMTGAVAGIFLTNQSLLLQ